MEPKTELDRISFVYEKYESDGSYKTKWDRSNPGNAWIVKEREEKILNAVRRHGFDSLVSKTILDVGCGGGGFLSSWLRYGASEQKVHGIDLLRNRIHKARQKTPGVNLFVGSGQYLPFDAASFDIVMQSTLFTSVLDPGIREDIGQEMLRVLKKDGIIIWYDFRFSNPGNPDVRGIKKKEIVSLFPKCKLDFDLVTLLPWLARRMGKRSLTLCTWLHKSPFLRTHWLVTITKSWENTK
jgi:ubiquinone/menaquinone biosynthesis C-methylase UbiE